MTVLCPSSPSWETLISFSNPPGEYVDEKGRLIIDEKEFLLIMKLKDLKEEYRCSYAELQDLKAEIQYCQHLVDQCRNKLISGTGTPGQLPSSTQQSCSAQEHLSTEALHRLVAYTTSPCHSLLWFFSLPSWFVFCWWLLCFYLFVLSYLFIYFEIPLNFCRFSLTDNDILLPDHTTRCIPVG